jgi:hypothetical protein
MATATVPPAAGVPPAGVPGPAVPTVHGPAPPPLPFPGDPGTVTGWLLERSASISSNALAKEIEAGFARLTANIPADPTNADYPGAMRDLVDEVLNSADLCCYLTVSATGAASARVTVIHSIGKYSAGFGALSAFQGTIMGFLGETVGDQLPIFVRAPVAVDEKDLIASFAIKQLAVPTEAEIVAYFSGQGAGHLLNPVALTLANGTQLSRLCPIPLAWAAYFLDSKSPYEALRTGLQLIATLDTADERDRALPLASWLQTACVKRGLGAGDRRFSCLNTDWAALAPDAKVIRWAANRLAPFRKASPTLPTVPTTLPGISITGMAAGAATAALATKVYTPLEIQKIQAACSLAPAIYDSELPEIFVRMLEEGRTKVRTQALMRELLSPDEDDMFNAVHILVTEEMAKDFKDLNFGFNGDTSYTSCHRGISPFMVIPVSMTQASQRQRAAERFARVGANLTLADVTGAETIPDATPRNYRELMDVLKCYCFFLQRMHGARCHHFRETRAITRILGRQRQAFEGMTARQVATILWHVFMDARVYYSTLIDLSGSLPDSNLRVLRGMLETTMIPEQVNVPYGQLLAGAPAPAHTTSGQDSYEPPYSESGGEVPVDQRIFSRVPGPIRTALTGARTHYPSLRIAELMAAASPPIKYSAIKIGPNGACLDMLCLGRCQEPGCSYKHPLTRISIDPARAAAAASKLKQGYEAYKLAHTSTPSA